MKLKIKKTIAKKTKRSGLQLEAESAASRRDRKTLYNMSEDLSDSSNDPCRGTTV